MYDVIVIGQGPAGITAGIYTQRSNLKTLIIGTNQTALSKVKQIDNYYGMPHISGQDLYKIGINQVKELGAEIINDDVLTIKMNHSTQKGFNVKTATNEFITKTIIIATGTVRTIPNIANLKDYQDKNISFCAICDGFFYRNKNVYVLGYNDYAIEEAEELKKVASSVTILTNGVKPIFSKKTNIVVNENKIIKFIGNDYLEQIEFEHETLTIPGLFIAWGTPGGFEFAKKLGLEIQNNQVVVTKHMETNIPGIYACGDINGWPYQVHKATYEGMMAGLSVSKYLNNK